MFVLDVDVVLTVSATGVCSKLCVDTTRSSPIIGLTCVADNFLEVCCEWVEEEEAIIEVEDEAADADAALLLRDPFIRCDLHITADVRKWRLLQYITHIRWCAPVAVQI